MHNLTASAIQSSILTHPPPLSTREALSGILGSVSLACWIFLLIPQLIENYRNQSAEAVSLAFVCIWFIGDVTNLLGGLWLELVPTVIATAAYWCLTDGVLIGQCLYYGIRNRRRDGLTWMKAARDSVTSDVNGSAADAVANVARSERVAGEHRVAIDEEDDGEEQPLLKRTRSGTGGRRASITIPGSTTQPLARRRSSANSTARRRSSLADDRLAKILEEQDSVSGARLWLNNILGVLLVMAVGAFGWFVAYQSGAWRPQSIVGNDDDKPVARGAQILGYISAIAYLGARIPQIIKNWREQSCEGEFRSKYPTSGHIANCGLHRSLSTVFRPIADWKLDVRRKYSIPLN